MKVKMFPSLASIGNTKGGIPTVIRAYYKYADEFGIEFVDGDDYDLAISHAGLGGSRAARAQCEIAMLHGIYFTAEYRALKWEMKANAAVIDSILSSISVTSPSDWVSATLRREYKIDPYIIQHGVDFESWQHDRTYNPKQVFWGKNRIYTDVCNPDSLINLAERMPDINFVTTMAPEEYPKNVMVVGLLDGDDIRRVVQESAVVLSTVPETWGILYIESMAAGTPVVTVNRGHVPTLAPHGVASYVYANGNMEDMERGVRWAIRHRDKLSRNCVYIAKQYPWEKSVSQLKQVLDVTRRERDALYPDRYKKTSRGATN